MPLKYTVKEDAPGLLLLVNGNGVLTVDDVDKFGSFFGTYLREDTPFKLFFDLRKVKNADMKAMKTMIKYMNAFENDAQDKVLASTILIEGDIVQRLINMLFNIKKPVTPIKVTSSIEDACTFLNSV